MSLCTRTSRHNRSARALPTYGHFPHVYAVHVHQINILCACRSFYYRTHTALPNLYQPATDLRSVLFCGSSYMCAWHSSRRLVLQYDVWQPSLLAGYRARHVLQQY